MSAWAWKARHINLAAFRGKHFCENFHKALILLLEEDSRRDEHY